MNAMMTVTISKSPGLSFRMKIDMTIAANGDSLFSMFASAMAILLIAQKFAKMPIDPTVLRARSARRHPSWILIPSPERMTIKRETKQATRFRKNAFSMTGRSPESFTKKLIIANPNAASRICNIPLDLLLIFFSINISPGT